MEAPASMARLATTALVVSMDMGIETRLAISSMTGTTRSISSSAVTVSEKGQRRLQTAFGLVPRRHRT